MLAETIFLILFIVSGVCFLLWLLLFSSFGLSTVSGPALFTSISSTVDVTNVRLVVPYDFVFFNFFSSSQSLLTASRFFANTRC